MALKNVSALSILQIATYIMPLIILPYVIKVIGIEQFGIAAFIIAVINFFVIFVDYGFNLSATRSISVSREDPSTLSEIFSTVILIKLIFSAIGLFALLILCAYFERFGEHSTLYFAAYIIVLGQALSPVFYFQGIERMVTITKVGVITKFLVLLLTFIFVQESDDLFEYIFVFSLSYMLPSAILLHLALRDFGLKLKFPRANLISRELRDGFSFFGVSAMSSILASAGIVFLGIFATKEVVGAYSAVERLVKAALSFFAPITQAFYPYSSNLFSKSYTDGVIFIKKLSVVIFLLASFTCLVMIILSDQIINLLYSSSVLPYAVVFSLLAPWFILSLLNNCFGVQFMSNVGLSRVYFYFFCLAGLICLLLYYTLIPIFGFKGVCYSMILSELILFLSMLAVFLLRDKFIQDRK